MAESAKINTFTVYIFKFIFRAFDVDMLYLAQYFNIPIAEVAINWQEIEGMTYYDKNMENIDNLTLKSVYISKLVCFLILKKNHLFAWLLGVSFMLVKFKKILF